MCHVVLSCCRPQFKMSVKQFTPHIVGKLDFASVGSYLAKHDVISVEECSLYHQQLQNGSSTNTDVIHKLLPKIEQSPRLFYRGLRESVSDKCQSVHRGNKALFDSLPQDFVSDAMHTLSSVKI